MTVSRRSFNRIRQLAPTCPSGRQVTVSRRPQFGLMIRPHRSRARIVQSYSPDGASTRVVGQVSDGVSASVVCVDDFDRVSVVTLDVQQLTVARHRAQCCPRRRRQQHQQQLQHTHTHPFNGPLSGTTRVSRYQKGKTNLDFTEARDSEWQWHQLPVICKSAPRSREITTPAPNHSVFYRPDALSATQPTASKH